MHTHTLPTYTYIHTHLHTHPQRPTQACTHTHAQTRVQTHTRTHTHTHKHTHLDVCAKPFFFPRRFLFSFPAPLKFIVFSIAVLARLLFIFILWHTRICFAASHYKHFRTPDLRSALQNTNDTIFFFCIIARLLTFSIALLLRGIFGPEIRAGPNRPL